MAGGGAVNRGPHTGSGTEAAASDLNGPQRKSKLSDFDFSEIARLQIPPAAGIANYAVFDKDDALAVHGSLPTFTKSFQPDEVRELIDIFAQASAPAVSQAELRENSKQITLAGTQYVVSGPRGAQHPVEIATLHAEDGESGKRDVLFAAPTATLLLVFQAAEGANTEEKTDAKEGLWAAVRSFAFALSEKGL
ncbi:hypothetical protein BCV70DRAFT_193889 [Testicularia cyperi]|uniref:Uncharacterized protein n=1 Tax=Testicularia cyperi TaxID=1882483 RepID=A0A317XJ74_9BASI|nr:hypothetical protein BCV70DRAFT_193889 [Testicularia cyperi]